MPSILRFQISFPPHFPSQAPLITFSSDIFHPLLTPLTTYSYSYSASDTQTVSASDQERLPPGGFSLRHGFPQWFGPGREGAKSPIGGVEHASNPPVTILEILEYLRKAFNEETFLDSIPLDAAANQGAYHAWHTHRARKLGATSRAASPQSGLSSKRSSGIESISGTLKGETDTTANARGRRPGQWNWDGVWEDRIRRGIQSSVSEQALFGSASAADELIRFSNLDSTALDIILAELRNGEITINTTT
jgi:hypothetical protein